MASPKTKKIAILGGGVGAMTAAFALTENKPSDGSTYEITVYQVGWRLGGKGASGRNLDHCDRIEEHGLHAWFGFYDNAFYVMRQCYKALGQLPDQPLGTWAQAFKPFHLGASGGRYCGDWHNALYDFPPNGLTPGERDVPNWATALSTAFSHFFTMLLYPLSESSPARDRPAAPVAWLSRKQARAMRRVLRLWRKAYRGLQRSGILRRLDPERPTIAKSARYAMNVAAQALRLTFAVISKLLWGERGSHHHDGFVPKSELCVMWAGLNLFYGNLQGLLQDAILLDGFDKINHFNYRDWIKDYIVDDNGLTINSPLANALYYGFFAYRGGDIDKPDMEAGTALRIMFRAMLTYKGAMMWKMQAGMGDVVFAPLYRVLKQRGVKFKFFHDIKALRLNQAGDAVAEIEVARQVTVKQGPDGSREYDPLVSIKGLPCWPATPRHEWLEEGDRLKQSGISLEDRGACWEPAERFSLYHRDSLPPDHKVPKDRQFDEVIFGISLGAIPHLCDDLLQANDRWQRMVDEVPTVATQASQLWLSPSAHGLGWAEGRTPILSFAVSHPLNTWGDFSHLIHRESWPNTHYPLHCAYFCGPMKAPESCPQAKSNKPCCDPDCPCQDQKAETQRVQHHMEELLNQHMGNLWKSCHRGDAFRWEWLVSPQAPSQDASALRHQHIRANVQQSERYVQSTVGSSAARLPSKGHHFHNLKLAGDWTRTPLNAGCVEAATMSGLQAANAILGRPEREGIFYLETGLDALFGKSTGSERSR